MKTSNILFLIKNVFKKCMEINVKWLWEPLVFCTHNVFINYILGCIHFILWSIESSEHNPFALTINRLYPIFLLLQNLVEMKKKWLNACSYVQCCIMILFLYLDCFWRPIFALNNLESSLKDNTCIVVPNKFLFQVTKVHLF